MTAVEPTSARSVMESTLGAERLRQDARPFSLDGLVPEVVVAPHDAEEIEKAMAAAWDHGLAVAPWGGGTRISIGSVPERLGAVLDMSRLDKVVSHNPADLTATVEAGITLDSLRQTLAQHGQFVAIDPPLPDRATVGGTLASMASGPLRWQYGHSRDLVIGLKVVQADGTSTKSGGEVVKNVSGYDMARLHIGALGTLGVITEVSFKLTPLPRRQATVLAGFDSTAASIAAALAVFRSHVTPLALTTFDDHANHRGSLTGMSGKTFLAVRLGGRPRTLERQVRECVRLSTDHGATSVETLDEPDADGLWRSTADFGWDERTEAPIQASVSVLPSVVSDTVEAIGRTTGETELRPAVIAHPAYGRVHVSWFDEEDALSDDVAVRVLRDTREAVHDLGGSLLVERCPLQVKGRLDVWDEVGESLGVMRRMKRQYDSRGVLNPGRFVGGI